ncbi:MAG: acetyl-CoA carboxylase biotin carboxylase subunit [Oligoflexus sp.]
MTRPRLQRILIANRGEIAVRIIRTVRDLGLQSVALYSDADQDSLHRKLADFAIHLPGRSSADTYLNIPAIIAAAKAAGVDAVHPGYGFLSENSNFAQAVTETGMKFIGPTPEAIATMGDKVQAKKLMQEHGVPTVPGSPGAIEKVEDLMALLAEIGFPMILKAAAGGGGRGMRVVYQKDELATAFTACQREAQAYFGNPQVFAERYIEHPRHIEIQVLCDGENGVHLFERDCSIQRRHQKLLEEAPSLYLDDKQRDRLGQLAVKAALAVGYEGAGTVEFICESPEQAYFMEMNTRIQVEHPVTEMITGVDLIAEQIKVANGEPLSLTQKHIHISGWSVEARINAEDVSQGFVPRPGILKRLQLPAGPGIRLDTHIYAGYEVPGEYDSMIAKLISWAPTRDEALARLRRALQELEIEGIPTTAAFHEALVQHPRFVSGEFSTRFLEEEGENLISSLGMNATPANGLEALATLLVDQMASAKQRTESKQEQRQVWQQTGRWENHRRI